MNLSSYHLKDGPLRKVLLQSIYSAKDYQSSEEINWWNNTSLMIFHKRKIRQRTFKYATLFWKRINIRKLNRSKIFPKKWEISWKIIITPILLFTETKKTIKIFKIFVPISTLMNSYWRTKTFTGEWWMQRKIDAH